MDFPVDFMASGRHHSQPLPSSRSRVSSNSSSYFSEREGHRDRDYSYRDRDYDRELPRDSYYNKEKDKERPRDREGERYRDRERERDRNKDRDADRMNKDRDADRAGKSGRSWQDEARVSPLEIPSSSIGTKGASVRVSGSGSPHSSENSLDSASTLSGHDHHHSPGNEGKDTEREPGELSSGSRSADDAGEGAVAGQRSSKSSKRHHHQGADADVPKGGSPNPPPKRRKYSPIVWDLDEKPPQKGPAIAVAPASAPHSSRISPVKPSAPLPPPPSGLPPSPPLPLPPPPPLTFLNTPHHHTPFRQTPPRSTPPAPVPRETTPSSGHTSTPPNALSSVSVARALSLSGPSGANNNNKSISLSPSGLKTSALSRSMTPSPSSPEHLQFSPYGAESNSEKDHQNAHVRDSSSKSPLSQDEPEPGQLFNSPRQEDDSDTAPRINIAASRWAEENMSPADEKSPYGGSGKTKTQRSLSSESDEGHLASDQDGGRQDSPHSMSPEPGEYIKDKTENLAVMEGKENDVRQDEQYDKELNERELMELDDDVHHDGEEQHPEVESEEEEPSTVPAPPPQRTINMLQGCRSVDEFERLNKIDEGTYGVVYRAKNKKTGEIVALKKVKMEKEKEGFPMTSLREINVLLSIHHPSIVDVKEVVVGSNLDSIYMVMEYMEHDLKGLMETIKQPFSQSEVKCLMLQLFEGVKYLHDNWVLHRDLKTSNLLLNNRGELKICDFGLARQYGSPLKSYTHMVVTLWYRAPELLLGATQYSTAVDMWSLGCIMAEFLAKEPLFNGKSEVDQLDKIYKTLGTPNETIWPDYAKLPGVKCHFVRQPFNRLREKFPPTAFAGRPPLSERGFNLLNRLLLYDPKKRITAEEALKHDWFKEVPLPKMKELMPTFPARSEHDRRMRRLMKSPDPLVEQRKRELQQAELGAGGLFG